MRKSFKKLSLVFLGIFFVLFGLILMPFPILPGIILVLIGIVILSFEYPYIENFIERFIHRNDRLHTEYKKAKKYMKEFRDGKDSDTDA